MLGVLTRVGINLLFGPDFADISHKQEEIFYDLPANMLGCFILGTYTSCKAAIRLPNILSLAVATGYAGSVTSMSH